MEHWKEENLQSRRNEPGWINEEIIYKIGPDWLTEIGDILPQLTDWKEIKQKMGQTIRRKYPLMKRIVTFLYKFR